MDVWHPSRISHGRHVRRDLRGHGRRLRDSPERGTGTGSMLWQVGSESPRTLTMMHDINAMILRLVYVKNHLSRFYDLS